MSGPAHGRVLERVTTPGGEARLVAGEVTERFFEVELGADSFRVAWDPRETEDRLVVTLAWTSPTTRPMDPTERIAVLDALWILAPLARGVSVIAEWIARSSCHVVRRWTRGPDGHLVRITNVLVEYLELERTLHAPYVRQGIQPPTAVLKTDEARWAYPEPATVSAAEWARVRPRLEGTTKNDIFLTDFTWKIVVPG